MIKIDYPVKASDQYEVVDKWGNTVIPSFVWNRSLDHLERQEEILNMVVNLMNSFYGNNGYSTWKQEASEVRSKEWLSLAEKVEENIISAPNSGIVESKPKNTRNPWGRKGKPKE